MQRSPRFRPAILVTLTSVFLTLAASAVTVLTFEGVGDREAVGNFYDGGAGGNLGIIFTHAYGLVGIDAGGSGGSGSAPSADTAMSFTKGGAAVMNVAAGFDSGFSFFYSAPSNAGHIKVYDGLNGTGNLLGSFALGSTSDHGAKDRKSFDNRFISAGVSFSGKARSVDFGGGAERIAFADITLGSRTPGAAIVRNVPDAGATLTLFGLALAGLGLVKRKIG